MVKLVKTETTSPDEPQLVDRPVRSRRWLRFPVLLLFAAFFVGSGWFSYRFASAANKIFTENTTGGSQLLEGKKTDESRINIVLIGIGGPGHDAPNLSDTIQLASIDPKAKTIAMLSLPRDLYVTAPSGGKVKINEIHSIGEDDGEDGGGPALLKKEVSDLLGVPVHYFVRVDFNGFKDLVDSVGGVDINVTEPLYDPYYPRGESAGYEVLNVKVGQQHMSGTQALKYARSRETTSDFDRSRRQQEVMVALRERATSLEYLTNPGKISSAIEIAGDHLKTDLSLRETERLARIVKDIPQTNIISTVVNADTPGLYDTTMLPGPGYVIIPVNGDYSYTRLKTFAKNFFEGIGVTKDAAKVEVQNASGIVGLAGSQAEELAGYGMAITGTLNATSLAQTTTIYDYTNGAKSATITFLENRYGVKAVKQAGAPGGPEIRIILGTDARAISDATAQPTF